MVRLLAVLALLLPVVLRAQSGYNPGYNPNYDPSVNKSYDPIYNPGVNADAATVRSNGGGNSRALELKRREAQLFENIGSLSPQPVKTPAFRVVNPAPQSSPVGKGVAVDVTAPVFLAPYPVAARKSKLGRTSNSLKSSRSKTPRLAQRRVPGRAPAAGADH